MGIRQKRGKRFDPMAPLEQGWAYLQYGQDKDRLDAYQKAKKEVGVSGLRTMSAELSAEGTLGEKSGTKAYWNEFADKLIDDAKTKKERGVKIQAAQRELELRNKQGGRFKTALASPNAFGSAASATLSKRFGLG